uniref:Uncharacterized protein n=1 Tax=Geospiza parvula TaxID=87175 RepID=A0A8C3Q6V8_GEOPR
MSPRQGAICSRQRNAACELEESELCSIHGDANEPQHLQQAPAAAVPHLPGAQEASWHQQGDATCERAVSADVENGFCTSDGSVREPLAPQGTAATHKEHKRILRRSLGERFRCHPVGTAVLILLLLVLVLALGAALAVQSGKGGAAAWAQPLGAERAPCSLHRAILRPSPLPPAAAPQVPGTAATSPLLPGCPNGWVGHNGVCYYFSRDYSTWDQGQERCSELGASLAIAQDEEAMDLLSRLCGKVDFWLGLRRRGERLHWGDGSSYSSRVPVFGNSQCVYLADERFRSDNCSSERPVSLQQGPSSPVTGAAQSTFSTLGSASFTSEPGTGLSFLSCTLCLALPLRLTSGPLHPQCQRWAGAAKEKSLQSILPPMLPAVSALPSLCVRNMVHYLHFL